MIDNVKINDTISFHHDLDKDHAYFTFQQINEDEPRTKIIREHIGVIRLMAFTIESAQIKYKELLKAHQNETDEMKAEINRLHVELGHIDVNDETSVENNIALMHNNDNNQID